ncbi:MAG: homoserine O-acetyltransferase [Candidatus Ratteibacteria bacterium]|jgi:homoserine O-acetyltransferase
MEKSVGIVETKYVTLAQPPSDLLLENGRRFGPITIAYETYGHLNKERTNTILILHALSGDSHAAGYHKGDTKPGWWDAMVGPGKAFDTNQYFVICSNVLGGCRESTGPSSVNPKTGKRYGLDFPIITIGDMVNCQKMLLDFLGIEKLYAIAGGSMGGMQVLQWIANYPEMVRHAIPIATTLRHSAQQIAFGEVGRQAIMSDPDWNNGDYYGKKGPNKGLALARMIGHITYMSEFSMAEKFGRRMKDKEKFKFSFTQEFGVEGYLQYEFGEESTSTYLQYRGGSFVQRFDANSYLYITKAMDYFDLITDFTDEKNKTTLFQSVKTRFLVLSFSSDWLYPPANSKEIVRILKRHGAKVSYCEIASNYGHDSFLIESKEETSLIRNFLAAQKP